MDIGQLWQALLVDPLAQALLYLAEFTGSSGLAIILFTIIVKVVLFPLTWQQIKSQRAMIQLQPQLKRAQKQYAKDRVKLQEETMRIYKEANVNPAAGCLPLSFRCPSGSRSTRRSSTWPRRSPCSSRASSGSSAWPIPITCRG